ncbi:lysozyme inhibitor LprI family protein [Xanthobacter sp. VTT E-85241]|uniref:lysozyme inhibitor LprI family protein n=1 Tax=Roseixanthobacter finlandensis TaxID=3119922 RepID=UPI00372A4BAD
MGEARGAVCGSLRAGARRRAALLGCLMLVAAALPARAAEPNAWYSGEYKSCDQDTTPEIVRCITKLTEGWEARLETALKALSAQQTTPQQERLKASQKAWTAFRDADCAFYVNGEGTIARVEGAECRRVLTQQRAQELEQAGRP